MTASLHSIAKDDAYYNQNIKQTTLIIKLKKLSYITNSESRIFIQEEINFLTNLFT